MKRKLIASLLVLCLAFSVGFAHAKPCEPTTFSNVSPATFECMKKKLQDYGIDVPPGTMENFLAKGLLRVFYMMERPILLSKLRTNRFSSAVRPQPTK